MSLNAVKLLGIKITISQKKEILEFIEKRLGKSISIVTPNPEQLVRAQQEKDFAQIINRADVAIPDGIGVALALGVSRVPGVELMEDLVCLASKRRIAIGLIGGYGDLAVRAFECLKSKYPNLIGWGMEAPELDLGHMDGFADKVRQKIQTTGAGMVFVGLGAPKQEYFMETFNDLPIIRMAVGGSFGMITGDTPRAPKMFRFLGLEWLWRLSREPWRWRRQWALMKFIVLLAIKKSI